ILVPLILVAVSVRFWSAGVPVWELAAWAAVLGGVALLVYAGHWLLDRHLAMEVQRQGSLLQAVSDIGEGLVVTEDGRYVAGNDAYRALTGYTAHELAAFSSLIDLAPPDERRRPGGSVSTRAKRRAGPLA